MTKILLKDIDIKENRALSRIRSVFSLRNGIYTSLERVKLKYPNSNIYFRHPNIEYEKYISKIERVNPFSEHNEQVFDLHITSEDLSVFKLLDNVTKTILSDLELLDLSLYKSFIGDVIGNRKDTYIHNNTTIFPGCVIDTRYGVVIIDEGTIVSPFSYISGPIYIGKDSRIDSLKISGGCICGNHSRLGGEIENVIINDFSNKHHEGYVGHSILGSWVNIGAMATTSDLKNNYGIVKIEVPTQFYPINNYELSTISTKSDKFGSIIGDCVKVAIGTMINTGSVIDFGCNIFDGVLKYMPPLSWGKSGIKYDKNRFVLDCLTVYKRRKQTPPDELRKIIDNF